MNVSMTQSRRWSHDATYWQDDVICRISHLKKDLNILYSTSVFYAYTRAGVPSLFSILQGPPMPDISSYTVLLQQREKCLFLNNFFINQNICFALLFF